MKQSLMAECHICGNPVGTYVTYDELRLNLHTARPAAPGVCDATYAPVKEGNVYTAECPRCEAEVGVVQGTINMKAADHYEIAEHTRAWGEPCGGSGCRVKYPHHDREEAKVSDKDVENPSHYGGDVPYETIKCIEAWGLFGNGYLFNVIKYVSRAGKKDEAALKDLKKARWYLQRYIDRLENGVDENGVTRTSKP